MLTKLRTAVYHVTDIEAAKNWYTQLLGQQPYFDEPFYVGFAIDGFELGLDPDYTNITVGNNSYALWNVADIEATIATITAIGGTIHKVIETVGENMRVATCLDPWQNCIGLIEEK
jgi:predicted enzyme related to lactoylglutathione lyase